MELVHGTREEHLATLCRAKDNGITSCWTGDIRRNPYLRENLAFAESENVIKYLHVKEDWNGQSSEFVWEWNEVL